MATDKIQRRGHRRLSAAAALLVAILLYAVLPQELIPGPRLVIPILELVLVIALVSIHRVRPDRENWARNVSLVLIGLTAATNLLALFLLLRQLVSSDSHATQLLIAAGQVWLTNVIVFGLGYWELDRGGSQARMTLPRHELPRADFRFPQDEDHDAIEEVAAGSSAKSGWVPALIDYLYISLTNSSAFSPTDTMPLSTRAKILMGLESTAALVISVLVVARGVGSLTS